MNRLLLAAALLTAATLPAPAHADICVQVNTTSPFFMANVQECVSWPGAVICIRHTEGHPPHSVTILVCVPDIPIAPPPA